MPLRAGSAARYRWTVFRANLLHEAALLGSLISEGGDVPEKIAEAGQNPAPASGAAVP